MKINVFLPCKKNSSRVKNKNKRKFADIDFGLVKIKLNHLINSKLINKIYLSTNDLQIINYAKKLKKDKIIIHQRKDNSLSTSNTTTQKLINHASEIIPDGHILWTHVTSPLINSKTYDKIILRYKKALKTNYDSLMTITKLKGFFWNKKGPINYDFKKKKWPKTQDTSAINRINSGVFLSSRNNYIREKNRIGKKPFFYQLSKLEGLDIDEFEDFYFAEYIFKNKKKFLNKNYKT